MGPTTFFDVVLPSIDVYSDLSLIIPWYLNGHIKYALSMTVPLMFQFLSTSYKWFKIEKRENRWWAWIPLVLQCWPQWRALRIIHLDYKKDEKSERKKEELWREITGTEPFLEAWPSSMIMTVIWVSIVFGNKNQQSSWSQGIDNCNNSSRENICAVFNGPGGVEWFFITYSISILSATFGITKFPQVGPFAVLSREGGILKWKFILAPSSAILM